MKFQDGSPLNAEIVAQILRESLPKTLGPVFEDIEAIQPASEREIRIALRRPSAFPLEALLDVLVEKRGQGTSVGTGAFYTVSTGPDLIEMRANDAYYLGRPKIDRILIKSFSTARSAWAELLRGQIDMLYEVGFDALDSLKPASNVRVFTSPKNYAWIVMLNTRRGSLRHAKVRAALNGAVDRAQIIEKGLGGHGSPATGAVWPMNWAYDPNAASFDFDPGRAKQTIQSVIPAKTMALKCLTFEGPPYDRIALALQQQLSAVGVVLDVEGLPAEQYAKRVMSGDFDAALVDGHIGPNLLRSYQWWHSGVANNYAGFSSKLIDRELDAIRHSKSDADYRAGVSAFQRAIVEDPPAIFLAWSEVSRAISTRFEVPEEPGRDVRGTLRLWKPVGTDGASSRN